jgi:hypothetical protein
MELKLSIIITPQSSIEKVLYQKTKPLSISPSFTKAQKVWLYASGISLITGVLLGLLNKLLENDIVGVISIWLLLGSMISAVCYQISLVAPMLKEMKHSEKTVAENILSEFNNDIELIQCLSNDCSEHHLSFAKQNFIQLSNHLKSRINLLVGAIEKVGIIPLAVASYYSYKKASSGELISFGAIEIIATSVVVLYLFSIHMVTVSHKFERIALIYDAALELCKAKKSLKQGK